MKALSLIAVIVLVGCTDSHEQPTPVDPFSGATLGFTLEQPARALEGVPNESALVVVQELSDELLVVRAHGEGLEASQRLATGDGPRDVAALDLDGDGSCDLVSADTGGSTLSALLQNDVDDFAPPATYPVPRPPKSVAVLDFDRDDAMDLVVSAGLGADAGVETWRNVGGTPAEPGAQLPLADAGRVTVGQLDEDADPELAVAIASQDGVAVVDAARDGVLSLVTMLDVCASPRVARIADVDDSGLGDVVVACTGEALVIVDPLGSERRVVLPDVGQLYDLALADFDGDGWLDLAAVDASEHVLLLWLAPLSPSAPPPAVHPVARGPVALAPIDIDADGDFDLAVLAYEQRALQVLVNDGR
jgi:hypothetical protein